MANETKPFVYKPDAGKEKQGHHPHEHAWPKRKSFLPVFLVLALLAILGYGYLTNSFDAQYNRLETITLQLSEGGATIPISEENRNAFRNAIAEIQPVFLLNNGDVVTEMIQARIAFMDAQDGLFKRLESQACTRELEEKLQEAKNRAAGAKTWEENALRRLGKTPPEREKTFLAMIPFLQRAIEEEIQNCGPV